MNFYINFLDSKNGFKETRKEFETYGQAIQFMMDTFDTVNSDLINTI